MCSSDLSAHAASHGRRIWATRRGSRSQRARSSTTGPNARASPVVVRNSATHNGVTSIPTRLESVALNNAAPTLPRATAVNALTALTPQCAKLPIAFANDRDLLAQALPTLALSPGEAPRIVRVADTLSVAEMEASEALWSEVASRAGLEFVGDAREAAFDADGNLTPA